MLIYSTAWAFGGGVLACIIAWNPSLLRNLPLIGNMATEPIQPTPIPLVEESSPPQNIHLVVLVHGIFGSPLEMGNLQTFLEHQSRGADDNPAQEDTDTTFVIHSTAVNHGRTLDGVAAGGSRIAEEINVWLAATRTQYPQSRLTFSMVGNSLGGLYARYALSKIDWTDENDNSKTTLHPNVFCTTVTPHVSTERSIDPRAIYLLQQYFLLTTIA